MKDWFKEWFASEEYLNLYKHRDDQDAEKLLKLILNSVKIPKGAKVLDAACGSGRHSLSLARKGFDVTGFDLSRVLLDIAKENTAEEGLDIQFINADIREVTFCKKFDLIINLFTSFGYFDTERENFAFIHNSPEWLKPGGFFAFDYLNKEYLLSNYQPYTERVVDDKVFKEKRYIENSRIIKEIRIEQPDGLVRKFTESVKLYDKDKILEEFENAGFELEYIYGDYDGNNYFSDTSERLILIFSIN
jgi:2-polyprenyl-3-methyl-5-hydroxy-6-metoxy-1,4-benzoquinol methylase